MDPVGSLLGSLCNPIGILVECYGDDNWNPSMVPKQKLKGDPGEPMPPGDAAASGPVQELICKLEPQKAKPCLGNKDLYKS